MTVQIAPEVRQALMVFISAYATWYGTEMDGDTPNNEVIIAQALAYAKRELEAGNV